MNPLSGLLALALLGGCASKGLTPQQTAIINSTEVLCLVHLSSSTDERVTKAKPWVAAELAKKHVSCTPEMAKQGATMVLAEIRRREADEARWDAAGKVAKGALDVLLMIGVGMAASQAMAPPPPPPPRPIQCHTSYTYGGYNTTCQ